MRVKLRFLVVRNRIPTAHEVAVYRDEHGCTMTQAKAALLEETAPRLQYCQTEYGTGRMSDWQDVPTEIEVRE